MLDARIIANFVLDRADERGLGVSNLDLQKIVYFLHGHYLVQYHEPLVSGEFEAWPYGPVHRSIYDAFRAYNDTPIDGRATAFDPLKRQRRPLPPFSNERMVLMVNRVLDYYLDMPTFMRVELTHAEGTPWSRVVSDAEKRPNVGMRIPNDLIEKHFEGAGEALLTEA